MFLLYVTFRLHVKDKKTPEGNFPFRVRNSLVRDQQQAEGLAFKVSAEPSGPVKIILSCGIPGW